MSAYICDPCHLTAIAAYAVKNGIEGTVQSIGDMLLQENIKSVNARYREQTEMTFEPCPHGIHGGLAVVEIIKALHCYRYQSCEHEGWEGSAAHKLFLSLLDHATHTLPGYAGATWGARCDHPVASKEERHGDHTG